MKKLSDPKFTKDGYFYDIVGSFQTAFLGFTAFRSSNPIGFMPNDVIKMEGNAVSPLLLHPHRLLRQINANHLDQPRHFASLTCMLINTAYESVKEKNDHSPEFEFFRHLRNAASHKNCFNFYPHEPSRPAHWRGFSIDSSLKGQANPLFGKTCFMGYLGGADAVYLLWDIEQRLLRSTKT